MGIDFPCADSSGRDGEPVLRVDHRDDADREGSKPFCNALLVQIAHDLQAIRRNDDRVQIIAVICRPEGVVDGLDVGLSPASRAEEPFEVPPADSVRVDLGSRRAGESVRGESDQDALRFHSEGGPQERDVAVVKDVERPAEDDAHDWSISSSRYMSVPSRESRGP